MSALELDYRKCSISTKVGSTYFEKVGPDIGDSNPGIGLFFSGENRLGAVQKTALVGATLLIEFAYYLPQPIPRDLYDGGYSGGD